ncbi:MAG TPA: RHS repeat-associated core domain-containing protein [Chthonomonadales bacterium]|nr:RHS repeat-associated core domain-containing protein [Chthonomonadales bacterium]
MVTDSYTFKAFGEELAAGSGTTTPFQYIGAYSNCRDLADRLYVSCRHLRTALGRWMNVDPAGLQSDDVNLYRYIANQATVSIDPSGLQGFPLPQKRSAPHKLT